MEIQDDRVVSIHYTLTDDDKNVIDSSEGREPLVFLAGAKNIIPGLEDALKGKTTGEKLDVVIEPQDGYGERQDALIQQAPKSAFEGVDQLEVGMKFQAETNQGPIPVTITEVNEETVTVDGNHELAGVRLNFAVSVEDIREATKEELEHGHVHGANGEEPAAE